MLELGIVPIRYILMKKRLLFLYYILKEDKESMMFKVFETLNNDNRNGDFVFLTNQDRKDLDIDLTNSEIEGMSHFMWKKLVNNKVNISALKYLEAQNSKKKRLIISYFVN